MSKVRDRSKSSKTAPATNGKPAPTAEKLHDRIEADRIERQKVIVPRNQAFKDNTFPDTAQEMFDGMLAKIEWHIEQMRQQIAAVKAGNADVKHELAETANDARDVWALCELLYWQGSTAR